MDINIKPTSNQPDALREEKNKQQKEKKGKEAPEEKSESEKTEDTELIEDEKKGKTIDIKI